MGRKGQDLGASGLTYLHAVGELALLQGPCFSLEEVLSCSLPLLTVTVTGAATDPLVGKERERRQERASLG